LHGCLGFELFLVLIMFSFGCLALVKRVAGKIFAEITNDVFHPTQLTSCSLIQAAGPIEQRIEHKHTQTHQKSTQQTQIRE